MAVQIYKPKETPPQAINRFARDLLKDIQANFAMQQIWPNEVYPGYAQVNALRRSRGKWYSTGEGARSFEVQTNVATGRETIVLRYNDYLRYVDMGVGQHTKWGQVQAGKSARFNRRYISTWDRKHGQSHRPAILMQTHRVANRMMQYFEDYFARESYFIILKSIDSATPATLFI